MSSPWGDGGVAPGVGERPKRRAPLGHGVEHVQEVPRGSWRSWSSRVTTRVSPAPMDLSSLASSGAIGPRARGLLAEHPRAPGIGERRNLRAEILPVG